MKILFVASEAAPLAKVGGLGEVVGSLPRALNQLSYDVRLMIPRYGTIDVAQHRMGSVIRDLNVRVGQTVRPFNLQVTNLSDGMVVYLVDGSDFSNSHEVYGTNDLQRFLLFCRAVLQILPQLDWQPDIIHCHDWHTALLPMLLCESHPDCVSVFTIHNLDYRGQFDSNFLADSGLKEGWKSPAGSPALPYNFMAQGILWADIVTTVSETYAQEIVTPEYGAGLDEILRYRGDKLIGIINGINYDEYNPESDPLIHTRYDISTLNKRAMNKLALQEQLGLPKNAEMPIVGMVSRLDEQKGLDILFEGLSRLMEDFTAQLVIVGKGRERYHDLLKQAVDRYPHKMAALFVFDDTLARLVYAGSDMFLMPSRFEPCGLGQMVAMRYGAIPIVRRTGGLADTVQDLTQDLSEGTGFVFLDYSAEAVASAMRRAVTAYYERKASWHNVMQRIMAIDFSWQPSARKYESVYHKALESKGYVAK